jgi:hypothetical protein
VATKTESWTGAKNRAAPPQKKRLEFDKFQPGIADFHPEFTNFHPEFADFQPEFADLQPEFTNFHPGITDFQPRIADFRAEFTDFQSGNAVFQPEFTKNQPGNRDSSAEPAQSRWHSTRRNLLVLLSLERGHGFFQHPVNHNPNASILDAGSGD